MLMGIYFFKKFKNIFLKKFNCIFVYIFLKSLRLRNFLGYVLQV